MIWEKKMTLMKRKMRFRVGFGMMNIYDYAMTLYFLEGKEKKNKTPRPEV